MLVKILVKILIKIPVNILIKILVKIPVKILVKTLVNCCSLFCQRFVHFLSDPIGRAGRNNQQVNQKRGLRPLGAPWVPPAAGPRAPLGTPRRGGDPRGPKGSQSSLFWLAFFCFFVIFCFFQLSNGVGQKVNKQLTKSEHKLTSTLTSI